MRTYFKSNNIIKIIHKDRIIYITHRNLKLINKEFFKDVIKSAIIKQDKNYIILTGESYNVIILCFNDIHKFIEGCCGIFGLGLNKKDVLKYIIKN